MANDAKTVLQKATTNGFEAVIHVTRNDFLGGYIASLLTNKPSGDTPNHVYSDKGDCIDDAIEWRDTYERVTGKRTMVWAIE